MKSITKSAFLLARLSSASLMVRTYREVVGQLQREGTGGMEHKRIQGLVSVVIPCWNRQQYIRECLQHLAKQSYRNFEIIVVDDASTDGTKQVIRRWRLAQSPNLRRRIHLVELPKNTGYAGAMSVGMFLARGEFIALHDSDDYAHPDRLKKQVAYLRNHPGIGIVGTNYRVVEGNRVKWNTQPNWLAFGSQNVAARYRKKSHCITVGSVMLRGRLFDRYGAMNRRARGAEDWELMDRYIRLGVKADNLRDVLHFVRTHRQQRSHQFYGKKK